VSHPLVELRSVRKRFGSQVVLDGIDLRLERAEKLVVIGASGSGKSVLLKHIVGLLRPDDGEVWYDGRRLDSLTERRLMEVRRRIGFLFQMGALFDSLSVFDNIAFPVIEHTHATRESVRRQVEHKLSLVGLDGIGHKMPAELSRGQRKRVALARAIALEPGLILYDEPTTGLDPVRADVINELIRKLNRELRAASIVVTHDMNSAFKVGDRIVMLYEGRIIADGSPADIRGSTDERVRRFVVGEAGEQDLQALRGDGLFSA